MSTRSRIGFETASGAVMHIYCHWDGYVEGVGKALLLDHNDVNKAYELVNGGACVAICNQVRRYDTESEISWSNDRNAYKQDGAHSWEEYQYLWDSRKACWLWRRVSNNENWKRVDIALRNKSQENG